MRLVARKAIGYPFKVGLTGANSSRSRRVAKIMITIAKPAPVPIAKIVACKMSKLLSVIKNVTANIAQFAVNRVR